MPPHGASIPALVRRMRSGSAARRAAAVRDAEAAAPSAVAALESANASAEMREASAELLRDLARLGGARACSALVRAGAVPAMLRVLLGSDSDALLAGAGHVLCQLMENGSTADAVLAAGAAADAMPRLFELLRRGAEPVKHAASQAIGALASLHHRRPGVFAAACSAGHLAPMPGGHVCIGPLPVTAHPGLLLRRLWRSIRSALEGVLGAAALLLPFFGRADLSPLSGAPAQAASPAAAELAPAVAEPQLAARTAAAAAEGRLASAAAAAAGALSDAAPAVPAVVPPLRPPRVCAACGTTTGSLRRCGGCKAVRYCSESCCRTHWHQHRAECRRLQARRAAAHAAAAAERGSSEAGSLT